MFEHLKEHVKILVTGPQRSGTTICAKMIAVDTGHRFLSEGHLEGGGIRDQWNCLHKVLKTKNRIVVQCPTLSRWVHEFTSDDILIIFMMRDVSDIQRSEERIEWDGSKQLEYYRQPDYSNYHRNLSGSVSEVKYKFWEDAQKPVIGNWLEIEFESLSSHPLWVPKERRADFGPRQISEDNRFRSEIFLGE